jgi:hypothetical protein
MSPFGSRTEKGRLVLDGLTTLPEGTSADRVVNDGRDEAIAGAFRTTLDLFDTGLDLMRQNLRRRHPDAGDEEIGRLLREWLLDRPGAKSGDCPGRSVDGWG